MQRQQIRLVGGGQCALRRRRRDGVCTIVRVGLGGAHLLAAPSQVGTECVGERLGSTSIGSADKRLKSRDFPDKVTLPIPVL